MKVPAMFEKPPPRWMWWVVVGLLAGAAIGHAMDGNYAQAVVCAAGAVLTLWIGSLP